MSNTIRKLHVLGYATHGLACGSHRRVAHSVIMAVTVALLRIVRKIDFAMRDFD